MPHKLMVNFKMLLNPQNTVFKVIPLQQDQYTSRFFLPAIIENLLYSVPQGSILGPIKFIILYTYVVYINDLPEISKLVKFILYADNGNC